MFVFFEGEFQQLVMFVIEMVSYIYIYVLRNNNI